MKAVEKTSPMQETVHVIPTPSRKRSAVSAARNIVSGPTRPRKHRQERRCRQAWCWFHADMLCVQNAAPASSEQGNDAHLGQHVRSAARHASRRFLWCFRSKYRVFDATPTETTPLPEQPRRIKNGKIINVGLLCAFIAPTTPFSSFVCRPTTMVSTIERLRRQPQNASVLM
jgi:hypothetical protein